MRRFWLNLPAYLQIAALWPQIAYMYRVNLALNVVSVLLKVFLLKMVWTAAYAGRGSVDGIPLPTLVAYLTLTNLQTWLMRPMIPGLLQQRIREGQVALDLARPIPFLDQMLAQQFGATAALAPFAVLALPLAVYVGGMQPPASVVAGVLYPVSLLLAYLISMLMGLLIGLTAFWTMENRAIFFIYHFASQFFAGTLAPLWFFPPLLRSIAEVLPFQAQAFIPVSLYLGQLQGSALVAGLVLQIFWVVALYGLGWLMWQRAMRRVIIQGG